MSDGDSHTRHLTSRIDYSIRRQFVDRFHATHVGSVAKDSLVLDLGGQKTRKRGMFDIGKYPLRVICANLVTEKGADVQTNATALPFADRTFDVVICSELLEHVPEPQAVIHEAYRVLKNGGCLLATIPFLYRIHADPHDYGRYTDTALRRMLASVGFHQVEIKRQGAFWAVLCDFLKQYLTEVGWPKHTGRIGRRLFPRIQAWLMAKDQRAIDRQHPFLTSFTTGFGIHAVK